MLWVASPWFWLIAAVVLLGIELLVPTYFPFAFGLSAAFIALVVALIPSGVFLGLTELSILIFVWAVMGLVFWLVIGWKFGRAHQQGARADINDFVPRVEGSHDTDEKGQAAKNSASERKG